MKNILGSSLQNREIKFAVLFALLFASFLYKTSFTPHSVSTATIFTDDQVVVTQAVSARTLPATRVMTKSLTLQNRMTPTTIQPFPILPPQILKAITPAYPKEALASGIAGIVVVEAEIGLNGKVVSSTVKQSSGSSLLDSEGVNAVSQWEFSPAMQNGGAIASTFQVPVRFQIRGE